jgi:hypothetical protein
MYRHDPAQTPIFNPNAPCHHPFSTALPQIVNFEPGPQLFARAFLWSQMMLETIFCILHSAG